MKTIEEMKKETRDLFYRGAFTADIQNSATLDVVKELLQTIKNLLANLSLGERISNADVIPLFQTLAVLLFIPNTGLRETVKEILPLAKALIGQPLPDSDSAKPCQSFFVVSHMCDIIITMFVEPGEADNEGEDTSEAVENPPVQQDEAPHEENVSEEEPQAEEYNPEWSGPEEEAQSEEPDQQAAEAAPPTPGENLPEWATSTDQ